MDTWIIFSKIASCDEKFTLSGGALYFHILSTTSPLWNGRRWWKDILTFHFLHFAPFLYPTIFSSSGSEWLFSYWNVNSVLPTSVIEIILLICATGRFLCTTFSAIRRTTAITWCWTTEDEAGSSPENRLKYPNSSRYLLWIFIVCQYVDFGRIMWKSAGLNELALTTVNNLLVRTWVTTISPLASAHASHILKFDLWTFIQRKMSTSIVYT